MGNKIKD